MSDQLEIEFYKIVDRFFVLNNEYLAMFPPLFMYCLRVYLSHFN